MYTGFFGLREKPFSLAPDPRYLFLSASHREALAHLLYGIEEGEGFIEVIGQVGTGKTTLCRTLLDRIGSDAEIAYIFNPSPSEVELLSAINREFGLPTAVRTRTDLLDALNQFLVEKNAAGRRVLLVIDEAQNLDPAVLEQVRLLSNLETDRAKLLQIVLIGQPELEENLSRSDLRQLRQRITVRWSLRPLSRAEVAEYVEHRLRVAGLADPRLFTSGGTRALTRASRGIPRLINALADRALLAAYTEGRREVDARLVRRAARELPATELGGWRAATGLRRGLAAALVVAGIAAGFLATAFLPRAHPAAAPAAAATPAAAARRRRSRPSRRWCPRRSPAHRGPLHQRERGRRARSAARGLGLSADDRRRARPQPLSRRGALDLAAAACSRRTPRPRCCRRSTCRRSSSSSRAPASAATRRWSAWTTPAARCSRWGATRSSTAAPTCSASGPDASFYLWTNFESLPALEPGMKGPAVRWLQARLVGARRAPRGRRQRPVRRAHRRRGEGLPARRARSSRPAWSAPRR